jgi:hypothetical protein
MPIEFIFTIAAIITAIGVIIGGLVSIFRFSKKIIDAIGVDSKGRSISERLDRVEHQLWENGGSSLADRVNVINEHSVKTAAEVELIKDLLISARTEPVQIVKKTRHKNVG